MSDLSSMNFDHMTVAEFEQYLPELFASSEGKISEDPRFAKILAESPVTAALVRDLEAIADAAKNLFEPAEDAEPSDSVWSNIASKIKAAPSDSDDPSEALDPA